MCDGFSLPITVPPKEPEEAPSPPSGLLLFLEKAEAGDVCLTDPAKLNICL